MKPQTLAGQMAEFKATWFDLWAAVAKAWGVKSYEEALHRAAQRQREWWQDLERLP
jgi:hypothetical protein